VGIAAIRARRVSGVLLAAVLWYAGLAAQAVDPVRRLEAAVVSKFAQFAEWPGPALDGREQIEICVVQPNPFGTTLRELTTGERIGSRPLAIREVGRAQRLDSCHLLFVSAMTPAERRSLLARTGSLPILTVGDSPDFLDEGGIIGLRVQEGRVRFEVDAAAADRAGIRLSSQLLRLAVRVKGGQG
jgi:hypothetical protein